jgi:glycine/D-amino acid oxidase-like deaminating enzyme
VTDRYDLVIIGAGPGGLTAAEFAARLGAKVALVEKERIGGDCTWTGCVPSKALLKVAKVAHQVRSASDYGICVEPPAVDMAKVCAYVLQAVEAVYRRETPDRLVEQDIEVITGAARFLNVPGPGHCGVLRLAPSAPGGKKATGKDGTGKNAGHGHACGACNGCAVQGIERPAFEPRERSLLLSPWHPLVRPADRSAFRYRAGPSAGATV